MLSTTPQHLDPTDWKDLYVAALLEGDEDRIPPLIAESGKRVRPSA